MMGVGKRRGNLEYEKLRRVPFPISRTGGRQRVPDVQRANLAIVLSLPSLPSAPFPALGQILGGIFGCLFCWQVKLL